MHSPLYCSGLLCIWEIFASLKCARQPKGSAKPPCILLCDGHRSPQQGMETREETLLSGCSSNPNSPFAASFFSAKGKSIWLASFPQSTSYLSCFCICRLYGTCVTGGWVSRHSYERRQIRSMPPVDPILDHNRVSCRRAATAETYAPRADFFLFICTCCSS